MTQTPPIKDVDSFIDALDQHEPPALPRRKCKHEWEPDNTGLIDTCRLCGAERA